MSDAGGGAAEPDLDQMAGDALPPRPLAAFDLDGTLTRRDTLMPFLLRAVGRDRAYRAVLASSLPLARAAALGGTNRDAAKATVLRRVLAGVPLAALVEAAESYADHVVAHGLRPDVRARVDWHRSEGHELVLVSASPELYVAPIGRRLGFDEVLATRLEVDAAGLLTGRLMGANCRGPEKVVRLREWRGEALVVAYAYGDSTGDREMLALAASGVKLARRRPGRGPDAFPGQWAPGS
ncbi:MAG TPA: HAD-IB family hydrolase [Acidimicrobiia bacterium]|nr:HAD-IB family hydrolase [Acidimicrobiia bacterium]